MKTYEEILKIIANKIILSHDPVRCFVISTRDTAKSILAIKVREGGICPVCEGTGRALASRGTIKIDCPNCNSTGTLPDTTIESLILEARISEPALSQEEIKHILETQQALCEMGRSGGDDGSCELCRSIKGKLETPGSLIEDNQ